tara:strand:- start:1232 stop:1576 length:345 start_codon:yes stop_codon:yes gene_type:complete
MIKLTHESVGQVYVDGYGVNVNIFHMVTSEGGQEYYYGVDVNSPTSIHTYGNNGNVYGGSYNLVSLHTPVRPIEEVLADMVNELEFYVNDEPVQSATTRLRALLAEAQAFGVVE